MKGQNEEFYADLSHNCPGWARQGGGLFTGKPAAESGGLSPEDAEFLCGVAVGDSRGGKRREVSGRQMRQGWVTDGLWEVSDAWGL